MTREAREALAKALAKPWPQHWEKNSIIAAAQERLAQLPAQCELCEGSGEDGFDRNASHTEDCYVGYPCPDCHGSGKVYPQETVKKIAGVIHTFDDDIIDCDRLAVAVLDALGESE